MGKVVVFKQGTGKGKSLGVVFWICYLLYYCGFKPSDVHVNFNLKIPGVNIYDNEGIRKVMLKMARDEMPPRQIIGVDEFNTVFPARLFAKLEQIMALLKLNQVMKRGHWFFAIEHKGKASDLLLGQAAHIGVVPDLDLESDTLDLHFYDDDEQDDEGIIQVSPVSIFYDLYEREQPIL